MVRGLTSGVWRVVSACAVLTAMIIAVLAATSASPALADETGRYALTVVVADGQRVVVRWDPCEPITYRVNPTYLSSTPFGRRSGIRDVQVAMRLFSEISGLELVYAGTTPRIPRDTAAGRWYERQPGADVVVAWVRQGRAGAGRTEAGRAGARSNLLSGREVGAGGNAYRTWSAGGTVEAVAGKGYVVLDAGHRLRPGFGRGVTRGALLVHELGHVLGLGHVSARGQLMYPVLQWRKDAYPNSGDRAGLARLGRAAGCIDVPPDVRPPG